MGKHWKYTSGWICDGIEDVGKHYTVYDLNDVHPNEYLFEDTWTSLISMVLSVIPPEVITKLPRLDIP
eukprot:4625363-Karenia_brevis.AAC.1